MEWIICALLRFMNAGLVITRACYNIVPSEYYGAQTSGFYKILICQAPIRYDGQYVMMIVNKKIRDEIKC